jgi:hypothetical protein
MMRSEQRRHRPAHLLVHLVFCSLLLSIVARAQVVADEKKPLPLELKLNTTSLMLCVGSALPLNLELTNHGTEEIKIDKFYIWNRFTYGYLGDRNADRGGGQAWSCDDCPREGINLKTDKPYESSFNFPLDNDFFKDAGKYSIRV